MYFKSLYRSYFIRLEKEEIYAKCFENGNWIKLDPNVGLDENFAVVSINVKDTNLMLNNWFDKQTIKRINPLDHSRTVLSDFFVFEEVIRNIAKVLNDKWWTTRAMFIICIGYELKGGINEIEARALRDAAEHAGAKEVHIILNHISCTVHRADDLYEALIQVYGKSNRKKNKVLKKLDM
ncbi:MAG: hypothetical protein ED557_15005 [Balneola sp.]|nr:MAG: hypothetical protein ED557_15005 [Balneola sp.]